ncbi:MAG: DUF1735 and LamG domain-containing protein [Bacteroidales bacterium]|nr:DUF1735 and LamG domain-containing protein [Bacteroides sp.]MCM1198451.1 DUF1735 and LamG domain-containing protein [Clostridium sp.]MCM1501237.1 DUF1735 and LamG domain-containing protein [Bacteroidales bacterium]
MKSFVNIGCRHLAGALALGAILTGCTNVAEPYEAIYMTDAQSDTYKTITIDTPPEGIAFTVSSSVKAPQDITIELEVRADLLEAYNRQYGKNYVMAPEGCFELSSNTTSISKGFNLSDPVEMTVTSIDEFAEGSTYCVPVSIKSTSAMQVLEPSRTLFIVIKSPVISKAMYLGSSNKYKVPGFQEDPNLAALSQMTLETRVFVNSFQTRDPYISSIMGIEGICGVRFGDVKIANNVMQICHDSYQPAATDKPFDTGKWYHVAAVWTGATWDIYIDGQYATGTPTGGETIDLTSNNSGGFQIGASYGGGRTLDGYVAETRVWTRALSQSEIANNMNYVDPESDGLLAYWRMNAWEANPAGSGNIVKDLTGHGYDAVGGSSNPTMIDTKWL